jgi:hypothetical protein
LLNSAPSPLQQLVPLVIGGLLAAPVGGWAQRISARLLMTAVGSRSSCCRFSSSAVCSS